jgi:hypothetical protein
MLDIKTLLGLRPKGDSSEELKQALSGAEARRTEIDARIVALQERRAGVLLDGEAAEVEALERELATSRSELERVNLIIGALPARIAEADQRETEVRLNAIEQEAMALGDDGVALIGKIEAQSRMLFALVEQHDAIVGKLKGLNDQLRAGGRRRAQLPTSRAWGMDGVGPHVSELAPTLSLPAPWGGARTAESLDAQIRKAREGSMGAGLQLPWPRVAF